MNLSKGQTEAYNYNNIHVDVKKPKTTEIYFLGSGTKGGKTTSVPQIWNKAQAAMVAKVVSQSVLQVSADTHKRHTDTNNNENKIPKDQNKQKEFLFVHNKSCHPSSGDRR
jgi:hypothetical protein